MIKIIKPNRYETGYTHCRREEFLLDSVDDLALLPADCVAGSVAYTADMSIQYKMSPSKEWKQIEKSTVSWDNLEDKPFGVEKCVIEWDGNIEGRTSVDDKWYKVSDITPTADELIASTAQAYIRSTVGADAVIDFTEDNVVINNEYGWGFGEGTIICAYVDNTKLFGEYIFPESGIYFAKFEISTDEGMFSQQVDWMKWTTIAPLPDTFLPTTVQRVGEPLYLSSPNGTKYMLSVSDDGVLSAVAATE